MAFHRYRDNVRENPDPGYSPTYPSEGLNGQKPLHQEYEFDFGKAQIGDEQNKILDKVRGSIVAGMISGSLDDLILLAYVHQVSKTQIVETLREQWTCSGIVIGEANQKINPLSLLRSDTAIKVAPLTNVTKSYKSDIDVFLMTAISTAWRYQRSRFKNYSYKEKLLSRLRARLTDQMPIGLNTDDRNELLELLKLPFIVQRHSGWLTNTYLKIFLAACDMFFYKFSRNKFSSIRLGSVITKFDDFFLAETRYDKHLKEKTRELKANENQLVRNADDLPTEFRADLYYEWWKKHDFKMTDNMLKYAQDSVKKLPADLKPGTVGYAVREFFTTKFPILD